MENAGELCILICTSQKSGLALEVSLGKLHRLVLLELMTGLTIQRRLGKEIWTCSSSALSLNTVIDRCKKDANPNELL